MRRHPNAVPEGARESELRNTAGIAELVESYIALQPVSDQLLHAAFLPSRQARLQLCRFCLEPPIALRQMHAGRLKQMRRGECIEGLSLADECRIERPGEIK